MKEGSVTNVPPGGGRSFWIAGAELITLKATGEDTGGAYALWEMTAVSQGGPPPHIHHREDEVFYILEGEFEILLNEHTIKSGAGTFIHVPRGTLHTHSNVGTGPGKVLNLVTPAGFERFFQEVGEPATDPSSPPSHPGPVDIEKILATGRKYGTEYSPPPGQ